MAEQELPHAEEPGAVARPQTEAGPKAARAPTAAPAEEPEGRARRGSFLREVPILVVIALGLAILVKTFLLQAFYIPSASMEPTLEVGDRVLVNKVVYRIGDIDRGHIVVFENPDPGELPDRGLVGGFLNWLGEGLGFAQPEHEDYIKRVIGLPGETLEIRGRTVYIDGRPIAEPYLTPEARAAMADFGPVTVPEDSLFVMGDNRGNSSDSRYGLGFVPTDKVVGKAFVVVWPPSDIGLLS